MITYLIITVGGASAAVKIVCNIQEYNLPSLPCAVVPAANAQSRAAMIVDGINWFILSTDISGID